MNKGPDRDGSSLQTHPSTDGGRNPIASESGRVGKVDLWLLESDRNGLTAIADIFGHVVRRQIFLAVG